MRHTNHADEAFGQLIRHMVGGYRADGSRKTVVSRTSKRHSARRRGKAARQARKANR